MDTPANRKPNFDHAVTQWMVPSYSRADRT
jgi:hypothetical protein